MDSETVTSGIKKALVPLATADVSLSNWEGLSDVDFENISRQSARAATILALNGDLRQVERILRSPECQQSPDVRTFLSFFVTASNVSVDLIVNRIQAIKAEKSVEASAEAYGLLLILGRYQDSAWDEERSIKIIELLRKLYADHPDPGVHACAFWVLRWMKDPAAREALKVETEKLVAVGIERLLSQDLNRRNWFVDQKTRLTFIYMPPAEKVRLGDPRLEGVSADLYKVTRATTAFPRTVSIEHPFAIAMQEYPDMEAGNNAGPDFPEVCQPPKSELTWNTAAAMCDRLNETFKTPIKMYSEATNPLRLSAEAQDKKLGGYRLPTEDEWEYAARGGSTTDTPYGNRIAEFSGKLFTFLERPFPRGWHPPNQYGLFDAAGSMREWCEQVSVSLDDLSKRSSQRIVRGGGFESTGLSDLASWRRIMLPHQGGGNIGLRLTFTISKSRISDRARF